jgi:hypothetical protein
MIAFVVSVNGQRVCTIGVGDSGILGAHVSWVGRPEEPGDLELGIGGLDTRTDEHVRWPHPPEIKVGDTVTIQVIETDTVDAPTDRKTPAQLREEERAFLAEMEAERRARFAAEGRPLPETIDPTPPPSRRVPRDPDDELPPFATPWE